MLHSCCKEFPKMTKFSLFILIIFSLNTYGQYFSDQKIEFENLSDWTENSSEEYSKTYHFGFSETECELRIIVSDTICVAQLSSFIWRYEPAGFVDTFKTFTNVKIIGNNFYSDETNGKFLIYEYGNNLQYGLLIEKPFTYDSYEGGEFGSAMPDSKDVFLVGKYPQASTKILSISDLKKYKPEELQIMRNEIFARYGYIFKANGKMDNYFKKQDWYKSLYTKVEQWFTLIELLNLSTIQQAEKS